MYQLLQTASARLQSFMLFDPISVRATAGGEAAQKPLGKDIALGPRAGRCLS